jgi:hypothetical protein
MTESDALHELLAYFRIEQSDLDALARLRPSIEQHADSLVESFYTHLKRFPETRLLLENEEVRKRLFDSQR